MKKFSKTSVVFWSCNIHAQGVNKEPLRPRTVVKINFSSQMSKVPSTKTAGVVLKVLIPDSAATIKETKGCSLISRTKLGWETIIFLIESATSKKIKIKYHLVMNAFLHEISSWTFAFLMGVGKWRQLVVDL